MMSKKVDFMVEFIIYSSIFGGLFLSAFCLLLIGGNELEGAALGAGVLLLWFPCYFVLFAVELFAARFLYSIYKRLERCDFG